MTHSNSILAASPGRDLSQQDVNALVLRWQGQRDRRAMERLTDLCMPMVRALARRYGHSSIPIEDLVQVASLAFIKAVDRFDVERGVRLQSYAVPSILGELRRHFRDTGWAVHVPRGAQEDALAVREGLDALSSETGRTPTVDALAAHLGRDVEYVLDGLQVLRAYESDSLDTPSASEDEQQQPLIEMIGRADSRYELVEEAIVVTDALSALDAREREVLRMSFFEELSQAEIGARIGVSQMQISRILGAALKRVREVAEAGAAPMMTA